MARHLVSRSRRISRRSRAVSATMSARWRSGRTPDRRTAHRLAHLSPRRHAVPIATFFAAASAIRISLSSSTAVTEARFLAANANLRSRERPWRHRTFARSPSTARRWRSTSPAASEFFDDGFKRIVRPDGHVAHAGADGDRQAIGGPHQTPISLDHLWTGHRRQARIRAKTVDQPRLHFALPREKIAHDGDIRFAGRCGFEIRVEPVPCSETSNAG